MLINGNWYGVMSLTIRASQIQVSGVMIFGQLERLIVKIKPIPIALKTFMLRMAIWLLLQIKKLTVMQSIPRAEFILRGKATFYTGGLTFEPSCLPDKELGQLFGCYLATLLSIQQRVKKMKIGKAVQRVTLGQIQVK